MNLSTAGKIEWFGGNIDALNMYKIFVNLAHTWDDLIDKDKDVSESDINNAFLSCLFYLQINPFYKSIEKDILPMWITVVSSYETANYYENTKDIHGIEIAHSLRYAAGNIIAYAIHVCVGREKAKEILPEVWKDIFYERFDDYRNEHLNIKDGKN
tara:strand:+ start:108 stop:575 length:468 start_codon:yes stop_codon:yes gene_type:complete